MLRSAIRLPFNLAGIPLYLDFSFLLVLPLMAWGATQYMGQVLRVYDLDPHAFTGAAALGLGLVAALGLFASVVLHELGHSLTGRRYGVRVRRITLWFLGGVAEFEEMPRQRGAEAVVGIAGPVVSFALAALFFGLQAVVPKHAMQSVWLVSVYLATVNLALGVFNLVPAMPMDGGRILRSLLALRMPHARATAIAGGVAKVIAVLMGVWGLLHFNLWFVLLAFFIFSGVKNEARQGAVVDLLEGLGVADLMRPEVTTIPASLTVGQLAPLAFAQPDGAFRVVDDAGRTIGTIALDQVRQTHPATMVWQAMEPHPVTVHATAPALDAFKRMSEAGGGCVIVVDDAGNPVGVVGRADLSRALQARLAGFQTARNDGQAIHVNAQRAPWSPPQPSNNPSTTPSNHA
jgi:Zn-dependent protease